MVGVKTSQAKENSALHLLLLTARQPRQEMSVGVAPLLASWLSDSAGQRGCAGLVLLTSPEKAQD